MDRAISACKPEKVLLEACIPLLNSQQSYEVSHELSQFCSAVTEYPGLEQPIKIRDLCPHSSRGWEDLVGGVRRVCLASASHDRRHMNERA